MISKADQKNGLVTELLRYLKWCFNVLVVGVYPERDWQGNLCEKRGQQINTGDYKGALIQVRGDWEFFTLPEVLAFQRWDAVERMCWCCKASNNLLSPLLWSGDGWRGTDTSHEEYIAALVAEGIPVPILMGILTLRKEGCVIDGLHSMDQGITSRILANILVEMCQKGHWGGTQSLQVAGLEKEIKVWYKQNPDRHRIQGKLTWARLKASGDWPVLKAKAASTRHLTTFVKELTVKYGDGSPHDDRVKGLAHVLDRIYEILKNEPRKMSDSSKLELKELSQLLKGLYLTLAEEAALDPVRMWKITAKLHLVQHLLETQVDFQNPRFDTTYKDEDLQRIIKEIALSCHAANVVHMTIYKWVISMFEDAWPDSDDDLVE